jgi:hypothetical protein
MARPLRELALSDGEMQVLAARPGGTSRPGGTRRLGTRARVALACAVGLENETGPLGLGGQR